MAKQSIHERKMEALLKKSKIKYVAEHVFSSQRKFRFDFADPSALIGCDVQGGVWSKYRKGHNSPKKIIADMEKHNLATQEGWRVLYVVPSADGYLISFAGVIELWRGLLCS